MQIYRRIADHMDSYYNKVGTTMDNDKKKYAGEEKNRMRDAVRAGIGKAIKKAAIVTGVVLFFTSCGVVGRTAADGMEEGAGQADYKPLPGTLAEAGSFAYTDEENKLWLWEQGGEEPVLLTDKAFALEEKAKTGGSYWEEWEYWQEWDNRTGQWVWNQESALEGSVQKVPDGGVYFPQEMRWESFCMKRSAGEQEEALQYANEEAAGEYAGVRVFLYDLYRHGTEDEDGQSEEVAGNVCYYQMDGKGNIWYCRVESAGETGMDFPLAECTLYRYDGKENLKIGKINGRRKEPFRVDEEGEYVLFFALDDGLYGCKPGEEAELLVEGLCKDMFYEWGIYADADMGRIVYAKDSAIGIKDRRSGAQWRLEGEGELLFAGLAGEKADRIWTLRIEERTAYSDWIERGMEEGEDEDTRKLWELMERGGHGLYPSMCHAVMSDISRGEAENIQTVDGYLLDWPDVERGYSPGWSDAELVSGPRQIYYMEMIPKDSMEKFTLEEVLGEYTPGDVLEIYEGLKAEGGYQEIYGEAYEEYAFSDAFFRCMDGAALEKKADLYAVTAEGMRRTDGVEMENGIGVASAEYGGGSLYLKTYPRVDWQGNGTPYKWREDIYVLAGDGSCEKVVEAAEETAVRLGEVFYSRESGVFGLASLYRSGFSGRVATAVSISMESIRKSPRSNRILFLADGLIGDTEQTEDVRAVSVEELREAYWEQTGKKTGYGGEGGERTLVLADENGAQILAENVFRYGFYGEDSIWILQHEEKKADGEEDTEESDPYGWEAWSEEEDDSTRGGCLYIYENGEKKRIAERAVWMVGLERQKAAGAMWRYE